MGVGAALLQGPCGPAPREQAHGPPPRSRWSSGRGPSPVEMRPGGTSGLLVCSVCGLALITDERPSFEWKESNHCSGYEATIWKSFGRLFFFFFFCWKEALYLFIQAFRTGWHFQCFHFFFFNPPSACHSKITSIAVHHLARLLLPAIKPGMRKRLFVFHVPASLPLFGFVLFLLPVNQILKKNLQN